MAKILCPDVTTDHNNYSGPVPMIGFYIAATSILCFLLIICDVIHGLRQGKNWLPCRFFSLNSVTLTILSVATKLTVDLTTSMPSSHDQLSKLTGTALICICMGFLMPSLGANSSSECLANLMSLSILVVTAVVNICIQISTHVIFSFIVEHIIILVCMFFMLLVLWISAWDIDHQKKISVDHEKELLAEGTGSMLTRLKLSYLTGYNSNPQIILCRHPLNGLVVLCCINCLIIVVHATFGFFVPPELKVCVVASDYGRSTRVIVVAQILVISVGTFATCFRSFTIPGNIDSVCCKDLLSEDPTILILKNGPYLSYTGYRVEAIFYILSLYITKACMAVIVSPLLNLASSKFFLCKRLATECYRVYTERCTESEDTKEYRELLQEKGIKLEERVLRNGVQEIKRWTRGSRINYPNHLSLLLSKVTPSQQSPEQLNSHWNFRGNNVSCLHLVFLVRVASVSTPSRLSGHLIHCLGEVFDVIYFLDCKMNSLRFNNRKRCKLAKAMWMGSDFKRLSRIILKRLCNEPSYSQSELGCGLMITRELKTAFFDLSIWDEVGIIMDFINGREYTSVEELYGCMEQLFVDMLHIFLSHLPRVMFKQLMESHVEEYEERVGEMLKLLCGIESLQGLVEWNFPSGSNITSLITTRNSTADDNNSTPRTVDNTSDVLVHVSETVDQNAFRAQLIV